MTIYQNPNPVSDEEIAKLYLKASDDVPSQSLDSAILAAAHKAVQSKPKASKPQPKRYFLQRWQLPMSIAATVVMSFSLVTFMQHEKPDLVLPSSESQPASTVADASTAAKTSRSNNELVVAPSTSVQTLPEATEQTVHDKTDAEAISNVEKLDKKTVGKGADKVAEPTQSSRAEPFADEVAVQASPKAAAPTEAASEMAVAATAPIESKAETDAANNGATLKEKNVLAKKPSSNSAVAINDENSPENWLKNIENLRKQGELDAVRKNLKAFKLRYPDYTLPKDLIEFSE